MGAMRFEGRGRVCGRAFATVWVLFVVVTIAARAEARAVRDSVAEARTLTRWAGELLADTTLESRLRAIRNLSRAIELDPRNAQSWWMLARGHELGGLGHLARTYYRSSLRLDPDEPDVWTELGYSWKREWLQTLNPAALDSATSAFSMAARIRPGASTAWLGLVPLYYEQGEVEQAEAAAAKALAGFPRRPEALLAVGEIAFRRGYLERADSAFRVAMVKVHPSVRSLFDRPAWIGVSTPRGEAAGSTWDALDPDPTTSENELQLEYASRVAHALLLFTDPLRRELDARAEMYVRYGPPAKVQLNPYGSPMGTEYRNTAKGHPERPGRDIVAANYPADAQVWSYPDLGMRVVLQDRSLKGNYMLPQVSDPSRLPTPDPRVLAMRGDMVSLGRGQAVFPTRPPQDQLLDMRVSVARFSAEQRSRLVVQVQAPGAPSDNVSARWVVKDEAGREVARGTTPLGLSACDPTDRRVGDFSEELPPGRFEIFVSARDTHRRRSFARRLVEVSAPPPGLALSDVVLTCGDPGALVGTNEVRFEADLDSMAIGARPLVAYFEIAHLATETSGRSRFDYEYTVERARDASSRKAPANSPTLLSVTHQEEHEGPLRRQFASVPVQNLPAGRYHLTVRVRDLVSGQVAEGGANFTRQP